MIEGAATKRPRDVDLRFERLEKRGGGMKVGKCRDENI